VTLALATAATWLPGVPAASAQPTIRVGWPRRATQAGLKTYIVAQHVGEKPGSFSVYWALKDDSPIKSIADVKGKSVGINVFGSGLYGPLARLLERHGVDAKTDIKQVETGFPASEGATRSGRVDVGVLNQPFAARAEARVGYASCSPFRTS
jgi:ABC-type nitrate/sulfonate/bicarbonate transport system substrate-binding protein